MKSTTNLLFLAFSLLLLHSCKEKPATIEPDYPKEPGYVTFNLGENSFQETKDQPMLLFGCNTQLTPTSPHWHGPTAFKWNTSDQVLSKVPFGPKTDSLGTKYHVNKYYVASPPVVRKVNDSVQFDIGLVVPDQFIFDGKSPVQEIYLDYSILEKQFIIHIPIELDSSVINSKVKHIPFKVECSDLPWKDTDRIKNGQGASGIGAYQQVKSNKKSKSKSKGSGSFNSNEFFLPYTVKGTDIKTYNTEVTLLNDIMLYHEFKFVKLKNDNSGYDTISTIDVQDYYNHHQKTPVKMIAIKRDKGDIPCGCQPPVVKDGPYGE
jgi:hypothetical protein